MVKTELEGVWQTLEPLPEPMVNPPFIVVSGLPGTGKSYFCHRLKERLPAVVLESDALRRNLFPQPSYTAEESAQVFRAAHSLSGQLLRKGIAVIFDATNLEEKNREYLYHIAEKEGAKLVLVRVDAPPELVRERLLARKADPEARSEADWKVYQRMKKDGEPIRRRHFVVDTSRDIGPVIEKVLREIRRQR